MVLNFIDQLTPGALRLRALMEEALGGTVQANLYLSSKRKQGFKAHFDFHDVFAMHVMGEKTWIVFQGRADQSRSSIPMFEGWPREHHDQSKGELWRRSGSSPATCSICRAASTTTRSPTTAPACTSPWA